MLKIIDLLKKKGFRIAIAESCTGGELSAALTAAPGSSMYFDRGFVTYSSVAKIECLGVPETVIVQCGVVSEETARAMALGVLTHSSADVALSVTGIAGPDGGTEKDPVGKVCFGFAQRDQDCKSITHYFSGDRFSVRKQAVAFVMDWFLQQLS